MSGKQGFFTPLQPNAAMWVNKSRKLPNRGSDRDCESCMNNVKIGF